MGNWDLEVLARTLFGEARGESREGKEAVAAVIVNRLKIGRWGKNAASVCLAKKQFSCWNDADGNRPKMAAVTLADPAFAECMEIATAALDGSLEDRTKGSLHYHVEALSPFWAYRKSPVYRTGNHVFYNDIA